MVKLELDFVFAHALVRKYYNNGDTFVTKQELKKFADYIVHDMKGTIDAYCDVSDENIEELLSLHSKTIEKFEIARANGAKDEGYYYHNDFAEERSYMFVAGLEDEFGIISKMPVGMQTKLYDKFYGGEVFGISRPEEIEIEPDIL